MYLPFIRAKQFDLAALAELPETLVASRKVVPLLEPVVAIKKNQFKRIRDREYKFILIVNPSVGIYKQRTANPTIVSELVNDVFLGYDDCVIGFIIHPDTTLRDVSIFINSFPNHTHAFIHEYSFLSPEKLVELLYTDSKREYNIFIEGHSSSEYNSLFDRLKTVEILISDGFIRSVNNASYPPENYFFDLHTTYLNRGYDGFGDYTIIGKKYETSGGPAHAVTIHFTYINQTDDIWVKHYISDDIRQPTNPGGKFLQALNKLKAFLRNNPQYGSTLGANDYKQLNTYPGLGTVKKISMKHHIELLYDQL